MILTTEVGGQQWSVCSHALKARWPWCAAKWRGFLTKSGVGEEVQELDGGIDASDRAAATGCPGLLAAQQRLGQRRKYSSGLVFGKRRDGSLRMISSAQASVASKRGMDIQERFDGQDMYPGESRKCMD